MIPAFTIPALHLDRDPDYLAFIRTLPCCVCGRPGPSDPHHLGSGAVGAKASDYRTIPLCREHHNDAHAWTKSKWLAEQGDPEAVVQVCLIHFIEQKVVKGEGYDFSRPTS